MIRDRSGSIEDCQEGSGSIEDCQEGSGSIKDCQEGSGSILNCQVGRDEDLGPSGGLKESSIQQGVLMKMGSVDLIVCQGSSPSGKIDLRSRFELEWLYERARESSRDTIVK
jgi:hypothetical protein